MRDILRHTHTHTHIYVHKVNDMKCFHRAFRKCIGLASSSDCKFIHLLKKGSNST